MNSLASDIKIYLELSEFAKEKEKLFRERKKEK